ncbi:MAG: signal peptidase I [Alphaproteobacteria bacterium]|nr:signal peptidase I [Alphaproteobacteria bacterium]
MIKDKKTTKKDETTFKSWLKENAKALFWALLIALSVRSCALEPFNIPSGSMIPTLLVGDYLFVNKNSYGYSKYSFPFALAPISDRIFYSEPKQGDIVVFRLPTNPSVDFIKRVIGLPGDTIQVKAGVLHINNKPVKRNFKATVMQERQGQMLEHKLYDEVLPNGLIHEIIEFSDNEEADNTISFVVPENHFFMMGDNRDNSVDSRFLDKVGYVPKTHLIGHASFIFYSNNGYAPFVAFWSWPKSIRWNRLFRKIGP